MSAVRRATKPCPNEHSSADGRNRFSPSGEGANNKTERSHAQGVAPDRGRPTASIKPDFRPRLLPRCRPKSLNEPELAPVAARQRPVREHSLHSKPKSEAPQYSWTRPKDLLTD